MTRKKAKMRFVNINGCECVMDVYCSLLGTIYKALKEEDRIFDITIEGLSYQDYVRQYGGLVIPA